MENLIKIMITGLIEMMVKVLSAIMVSRRLLKPIHQKLDLKSILNLKLVLLEI
jgi:hypothetical protein